MGGLRLSSEVWHSGGVGADAFASFIEDEQVAYVDEEGDVLASSMAGARLIAYDEFPDALTSRGLRRRLCVPGDCEAAVEESGSAAKLPQEVGGVPASRMVWGVVGEGGRYVGLLSAE